MIADGHCLADRMASKGVSSLLGEHGKNHEPVEFLDARGIMRNK